MCKFLSQSGPFFAIWLLVSVFGPSAGAQTEDVLLAFTSTHGRVPYGGVIFDQQGNLYGTTTEGGSYGAGVVYILSPTGSGTWTGYPIYQFRGGTGDGSVPQGTLVFDSAGNLYGTTSGGGTYSSGTVFELEPTGGSTWKEKILHVFGGGSDGVSPAGSLVFDASGNLYGTTTFGGGSTNQGIAFELSPTGSGPWHETVLHRFAASSDGQNPFAGVILDASGNLYGTTRFGSASGSCVTENCGTAFELSPQAGGKWREKILHSFKGGATDGGNPWGPLVFDGQGNLYGTTYYGGGGSSCEFYCGTVFELSPEGGTWSETILHSFNANDGYFPLAGVILDQAGSIYGTTSEGGTVGQASGVVFELSPQAGTWAFTWLHNFPEQPGDGQVPGSGSLVMDAQGNLYGTTEAGGRVSSGNNGFGTVYEVTP